MMESRRRTLAIMATASSVAILGGLPSHLTGAMGAQLTEELSFGVAALGMAVSSVRLAAAIIAPYFGRLVDTLGATRSAQVAAVIAAIAFLGIAFTATNLWILVAWLVFSSVAAAMGQPAANRMLVTRVDARRLGVAFGIKQSAAPTSSMLAGFSVPIIALTLGWRWAYGAASLLALAVLVIVRRQGQARLAQAQAAGADAPARQPLSNVRLAEIAGRPTLYISYVVFATANASSGLIPAFFVTALVAAGGPASTGGLVLGIAGLSTVVVRIGAGYVSDKFETGHLRICALLLLIGTIGTAAIATGRPSTMVYGAVLGMAGGWGYNGVFWFAMVRAYSQAPGRISGFLGSSGFIGAVIGPLIFGVIAEILGYTIAWYFGATLALLAAVGMIVVSQRLRRLR